MSRRRDILKLEQAEDLAARTLAANDEAYLPAGYRFILAADRERVVSDLEGLRDCDRHDHRSDEEREACPDAARYSDGLKRTAKVYGVEP